MDSTSSIPKTTPTTSPSTARTITTATYSATRPSYTSSGTTRPRDAANLAVLDYKVDLIEAQRAAVHSEHDICQPYDPCPSCRVPDPPDDDSFGQHTYGYNALIYIYSDKAAARVGYMGAMDHKEKH